MQAFTYSQGSAASSSSKNFPVAESINGSLRLESFNAFNRVNLNAPATNLTSNNFGKTTSAAAARVYMVSLRLSF